MWPAFNPYQGLAPAVIRPQCVRAESRQRRLRACTCASASAWAMRQAFTSAAPAPARHVFESDAAQSVSGCQGSVQDAVQLVSAV